MDSMNNSVNNASGVVPNIPVSDATIAAVVSSIAGFFIFIILIVVIGYFSSLRRPGNATQMTQIRPGRPREKSKTKVLTRAVLEAMPVSIFADAKIAEEGERESSELGASLTQTESVGWTKENYNEVSARMPDAFIAVPEPALGCQSAELLPEIAQRIKRATIAGVTCLICVDDFVDGDRIRTLPCGHDFHPACIDPWLLDRSTACPSCRVSFLPLGTFETNSNLPFAMNNINNV